MCRRITCLGIILCLHICKCKVTACYPKKLPCSIINRCNYAYHHNIPALQFIYIWFINIYIACFFYLFIIFLIKVIKCIFMFFKNNIFSIFTKICNSFISNVFFMYPVWQPVCISNGILLKIGKYCSKVLIPKQHASKCIINGVPLLSWRKR